MTFEEMLQLTGFQQVGEDEMPIARGLLFGGFPAEMSLLKKQLVFVCGVDEQLDSQKYKAIRQRLNDDERTKSKLTVIPSIPGDESNKSGKFFVVSLTVGKDDPRALYQQAMPVLDAVLREEGIVPQSRCPICDIVGGDTLAYFDGRPAIVHMGCLRRWKDEGQEALELKQYNSGHLRGVIGGLIGGAVGSVPALLAVHLIDFFVGILFAIIPMGIYYGWKLFGGKLSRVTTVFTISYTVVLAVIVEVVDTWMRLRAEFPTWNVTLYETVGLYLDPQIFTQDLMGSLIISVIFSGIGVFFAWRLITRTDQHEIAELQIIFDEAIPLSTIVHGHQYYQHATMDDPPVDHNIGL